MNQWHEVAVKFIKEFPDGTLKRVTEKYLVNAVTFTDAEERIHKEIGQSVRGEFLVKAIKVIRFNDVFHYPDAETFYQAKLSMIIEDADSGKERSQKFVYLISANNIKEAYDRIVESLKGLMVSFDILELKKSPIIEIFPYESDKSEEQSKRSGTNVAYAMSEEE